MFQDTEEKPPETTVFVGNISDRAPDAMIRQMLQVLSHFLISYHMVVIYDSSGLESVTQ